MAAAALSGSRGVAGLRETKGLFFFFTLLCLVGLACSLVNKDKLEELMAKLKKAEKKLEWEKTEMAMNTELMDFYANVMDPLSGLVKKASKGLPENFPSLEGLMDSLKGFVEKAKNYVDEEYEELGEEIENSERKLQEAKKLIKMLEEEHEEF